MKNVIMKDAKLPSNKKIFSKISKGEMKQTQEILDMLLCKDPKLRLGSGAKSAKDHAWFKDYKVQMDVSAVNTMWTFEDILEKKIPPPLKRESILMSPGIKVLMKAKEEKEKMDSNVFVDFEPFNRDVELAKGVRGVFTAPAIQPPPSPRIDGIEEDFDIGDYLEDEDAPVLRNVSYKCKKNAFENDPRGEEVAIKETLLELSEFWRSFAKGFTYFGCDMKRDGNYIVDMSMVFKNRFYLEQYKKEIRAPILEQFKYVEGGS